MRAHLRSAAIAVAVLSGSSIAAQAAGSTMYGAAVKAAHAPTIERAIGRTSDISSFSSSSATRVSAVRVYQPAKK